MRTFLSFQHLPVSRPCSYVMLFEVPGLNLGEPKVESKVKQPAPQKEKPASAPSSKKEQKPKSVPVPSAVKVQKPGKQPTSSSAKVSKPVQHHKADTVAVMPSLSIFQSSQKTKLQRKMEEKLMGSRFRYLNQKLYESDSKEALQHFKQNPEDFKNYHEGFKSQVAHWPVNPVDLLIDGLKRDLMNSSKSAGRVLQVADMGCGEAKIMAHFESDKRIKINSFDLAAARPDVVVADMTKVPLPNQSVDVVIFCLSLMNTNFLDALREARRILKGESGILRVAEVESRFDDGPNAFISAVEALGFKKTSFDKSHRVFWLFEFRAASVEAKEKSVSLPANKPLLKPCLYKKR